MVIGGRAKQRKQKELLVEEEIRKKALQVYRPRAASERAAKDFRTGERGQNWEGASCRARAPAAAPATRGEPAIGRARLTGDSPCAPTRAVRRGIVGRRSRAGAHREYLRPAGDGERRSGPGNLLVRAEAGGGGNSRRLLRARWPGRGTGAGTLTGLDRRTHGRRGLAGIADTGSEARRGEARGNPRARAWARNPRVMMGRNEPVGVARSFGGREWVMFVDLYHSNSAAVVHCKYGTERAGCPDNRSAITLFSLDNSATTPGPGEKRLYSQLRARSLGAGNLECSAVKRGRFSYV